MPAAPLRLLEGEVEFQCEFAMIAADRLDEMRSLSARPPSPSTWMSDPKLKPGYKIVGTWEALQAILVCAANLSKLLWGSRSGKPQEREEREASRKPLRDKLGVKDESPIKPLKVRNQFEHFDEKLEKLYGDGKGAAVHASRNIDVQIGAGLPQPEQFGHYDTATGRVTFWTEELSIPDVLTEIRRIYAKTENGQKSNFKP